MVRSSLPICPSAASVKSDNMTLSPSARTPGACPRLSRPSFGNRADAMPPHPDLNRPRYDGARPRRNPGQALHGAGRQPGVRSVINRDAASRYPANQPRANRQRGNARRVSGQTASRRVGKHLAIRNRAINRLPRTGRTGAHRPPGSGGPRQIRAVRAPMATHRRHSAPRQVSTRRTIRVPANARLRGQPARHDPPMLLPGRSGQGRRDPPNRAHPTGAADTIQNR